MFYAAYVLFVASGIYLSLKSQTAFHLYLHKKFTLVTPYVEPLGFMDYFVAVAFSFLIGPLNGAIAWSVVYYRLKAQEITLKQGWNAKIGETYYK